MRKVRLYQKGKNVFTFSSLSQHSSRAKKVHYCRSLLGWSEYTIERVEASAYTCITNSRMY